MIVNSDEEPHLEEWMENGRELGHWDDERIKLLVAEDEEDLTAAMRAAFDFGADYFICDTRGGSTELNHAIIANSDFIVIPVFPTRGEIGSAFRSMEYVQEFLQSEDIPALSGFLLNRVPTDKDGNFDPSKLSQDSREGWEILEDFPHFQTKIPLREDFRIQIARGLLNKCRDKLKNDPATAFRAPKFTKLLVYGVGILNEIDAALATQEEARDVKEA